MKLESLERAINKLGLRIQRCEKYILPDPNFPKKKELVAFKKVVGPKYILEYRDEEFALKIRGVEGISSGVYLYSYDVHHALRRKILTADATSYTVNGKTIKGVYCTKIKDVVKLLTEPA